MPRIDCRHFNGYKPCGKSDHCDHSCTQFSGVVQRILVVHLEALGAVLRATTILPGIRSQYPMAHITWVTQAPAQYLLANNSLIDRVLTTSSEDLLALSALSFDVSFCVDKSLKATGVMKLANSKKTLGFAANEQGVILPLNPEAEELWALGLSNHDKFFVNKKTENQLLWEALNLGPYHRTTYQYQLTTEEVALAQRRRQDWSAEGKKLVVGINTGCSTVIAYKKLSIEGHRKLIELIQLDPRFQVVLLGGKEDAERNTLIAKTTNAIESPTHLGLRDGACSIEACDYIITGDSFGMHMSIALNKWVIAWFGPTCDHEIDLYDRGEKIKAAAACSPCWRRSCQKPIMCYDLVSLEQIVEALKRACSNNEHSRGRNNCQTSSYKQPFSGISF